MFFPNLFVYPLVAGPLLDFSCSTIQTSDLVSFSFVNVVYIFEEIKIKAGVLADANGNESSRRSQQLAYTGIKETNVHEQ
jgi:hypothetical protein